MAKHISCAALICLLSFGAVAQARQLGNLAIRGHSSSSSSSSSSNIVFGLCSSGNTVHNRILDVESWWQTQYNGLLLVDNVPEGLPALPKGLQVQSSDKWDFVSSAERCAWSQIADAHTAYPSADWYVLGDDDTFFVPEALQTVLSKYNASKPFYLGAPSESGKQNYDLGIWLLSTGAQLGKFAFGGGGIIISRGLMQAMIPDYEQCLHDHDGMIGGDQRIGACVKVLSPGTDLTPYFGMHQIDTVHHENDLLAFLEAHPVQPLLSLHHMADVSLPGLGDLFGLRPYVKRNPYGILQQTVCQSKHYGTFSISAGLSVRWWDNSTDISTDNVMDPAMRGALPAVGRYFVYADSLNTQANLRSRTINTWYAMYDAPDADSQASASMAKIQVEEPAGPARWTSNNWERLHCSLVSENTADNSVHIVLGSPQTIPS
ncbi:TPA: hypothetical protein ACH3X1_005292 [Trebouxia sp. C0004]